MDVNLKDLIAPSFYDLHCDLAEDQYTHYWLKGGRGSTKSSFVSLEIILGMMKNPKANTVALRKVAENLKDSVYAQLLWAIEVLGVDAYWQTKLSPLELIYIPTGQKIIFRGADKPKKIKSTKFRQGYCKYIWYEEVAEFNGVEELRVINQSLMRGGEKFVVFYSYNPPQSQRNWVNTEVLETRPDRIVHHSSYLTVPRHWLGEQFFIEAEHLKKTKPDNYEHEYLGEVTGTGGEIFKNVTVRAIADDKIKTFDRICEGLDWGYAIDPFAWVKCHYDKTRRKLYIYDEIYKVGMSNRQAAIAIQTKGQDTVVIADSAEPKSIADMKEMGIRIRPAQKGPGSIEFGMKFLINEVEEIIIDNARCPNTSEEFLNYEFEKDNNDNFKSNYPDKNNHTIDAVRYALEEYMLEMKRRGPVKVAGI